MPKFQHLLATQLSLLICVREWIRFIPYRILSQAYSTVGYPKLGRYPILPLRAHIYFMKTRQTAQSGSLHPICSVIPADPLPISAYDGPPPSALVCNGLQFRQLSRDALAFKDQKRWLKTRAIARRSGKRAAKLYSPNAKVEARRPREAK